MKLRVMKAPPCCAGAIMVIFGTDFADTSPRFISGPQAMRMASSRAFSASSASSSTGRSYPVIPRSAARITTIGMPLSIIVTSTPSMTSTALRVGSKAPHMEPATSSKTSGTAAEPPGTPSISSSPAYDGTPLGVWMVAVATCPVLRMKIRTSVLSPRASTRPRSMANPPTPARMLPQFCASVTIA